MTFATSSHASLNGTSLDSCKVQDLSTGSSTVFVKEINVYDGKISISGDYPSCGGVEQIHITPRGDLF